MYNNTCKILVNLFIYLTEKITNDNSSTAYEDHIKRNQV